MSTSWRARARQVGRAGGFVVATAATLPLLLAHRARVPARERHLVRDLWVRRWASGLLSLFRVDVRVMGPVPPRTHSGRLVVSNHYGATDVLALLATFGGAMVSYASVAGWPIVGVAARAAGTVFVERTPMSGASVIRAMTRRLGRGESIAIFPEGGMYAGDDVRPFHAGGFVAALGAGAEIVPVGLAYSSASCPPFVERFGPHFLRISKNEATRVALAVGAPISTSRASRAEDLAARARQEVISLVARARQVCEARPDAASREIDRL